MTSSAAVGMSVTLMVPPRRQTPVPRPNAGGQAIYIGLRLCRSSGSGSLLGAR